MEEDLICTVNGKHGKSLKIYRDAYADNPMEDEGMLSKFICFHKKYDLGHSHTIGSDLGSIENVKKEIHKQHKDIVLMRDLYLYDHSGITISNSSLHL